MRSYDVLGANHDRISLHSMEDSTTHEKYRKRRCFTAYSETKE